jgi:hypothetical protein
MFLGLSLSPRVVGAWSKFSLVNPSLRGIVSLFVPFVSGRGWAWVTAIDVDAFPWTVRVPLTLGEAKFFGISVDLTSLICSGDWVDTTRNWARNLWRIWSRSNWRGVIVKHFGKSTGWGMRTVCNIKLLVLAMVAATSAVETRSSTSMTPRSRFRA